MKTCIGLWAALAVGIGMLPETASAQGFGIGPRFSFVRGNLSAGTPSTRLVGATVRMVTGKHTAIEGSLDYRAFMNEAKTERTRETPMQGSLLLFLVRSTLAPYVAGGLGVYTQTHDTLGPAGVVTLSTSERRVGWHLGAGAEIKFHRHAAFFLDYRFRFVKFGEPAEGQELIDIPGTTIVPVLEKVKLSHEGSMWTSGMAFYF
jgi:opacity protein-like surface antigen